MSPYYLQRGKIKVWDNNSPTKNLSDFVDLDYMGSYEFENGAMTKSLLTARNNKDLFSFYNTGLVNKSGKCFYLYCPKQYFHDTVRFLKKATNGNRTGKLTKEYNNLYESFTEPTIMTEDIYFINYYKQMGYVSMFTNFWWDIENHFGIILGTEQDLNHFKESIANMYKYYDKKFFGFAEDYNK